MKQKRFNVEQIVALLKKQAEVGFPLAELIRQVGIPNRLSIDGRNSMSGWKSTRFAS